MKFKGTFTECSGIPPHSGFHSPAPVNSVATFLLLKPGVRFSYCFLVYSSLLNFETIGKLFFSSLKRILNLYWNIDIL